MPTSHRNESAVVIFTCKSFVIFHRLNFYMNTRVNYTNKNIERTTLAMLQCCWDGLTQQLSDKPQNRNYKRVRAARVTYSRLSYDTNSRYLINFLGWVHLCGRRAKQRAVNMYTNIKKLASHFLETISMTGKIGHSQRLA